MQKVALPQAPVLFLLPVHFRDWCGTPAVTKKKLLHVSSCHDSCPVQAEQCLYNVYKTASFLTSIFFFRLFTFCPLLFLRPFALPFHVHHLLLLLPLPLSPSCHNVPIFAALPCLLNFCLSTFSKTYKTSRSPKKRFSCTIHTIHSINSTSPSFFSVVWRRLSSLFCVPSSFSFLLGSSHLFVVSSFHISFMPVPVQHWKGGTIPGPFT